MDSYKIKVVATSKEDVHHVEASVNALSNEAILDAVKELIVSEVKTLKNAVKIDIKIFKTDS